MLKLLTYKGQITGYAFPVVLSILHSTLLKRVQKQLTFTHLVKFQGGFYFMATSRLNKIIKTASTTPQRLIRLFNDPEDCSELTPEQVVIVISHPNATAELFEAVVASDFRCYPTVIKQLTKRGELLNENLICFIADVLVSNAYRWDEDSWYTVMLAFKELISEYELENFEDLLTFTYAECVDLDTPEDPYFENEDSHYCEIHSKFFSPIINNPA